MIDGDSMSLMTGCIELSITDQLLKPDDQFVMNQTRWRPLRGRGPAGRGRGPTGEAN